MARRLLTAVAFYCLENHVIIESMVFRRELMQVILTHCVLLSSATATAIKAVANEWFISW